MNNNRNKIFIISLLIIIFSAIVYVSVPNIGLVNATEIDPNDRLQLILKDENKNMDLVSKIVTPPDGPLETFQIYEHRGHSKPINTSYEAAEGHTGIQDINGFLATHTNNVRDTGLGWYRSLQYDTSIYCREHGRTFPDIDDILLAVFHKGNDVGGTVDTNDMHLDKKIIDYVEKNVDIACQHTVTVSPIEWDEGGIETLKTEVSERDLDFERDGGKYIQHTLVRLNYTAEPKEFDNALSYIVSFNERLYYANDPSQQAAWIYMNHKEAGTYSGASEKGVALFEAGMAVEELKEPTTPKMQAIEYPDADEPFLATGTVIDGSNYKVGPIEMNDYSYAWTENFLEFSGKQSLEELTDPNSEVYKSLSEEEKTYFAGLDATQKNTYEGLICGVIFAQVELDNGKKITLTKDNIIHGNQDSNRTTFVNEYYESPSLHGYEFPTPNSDFYILLPIEDCAGANKITRITMKYKYTTADGKGGYLTGYFDDLEWTGTKGFHYEDCHYDCSNEIAGYECKAEGIEWNKRSAYPGWDTNVNLVAHNFECGEDGYCEYGTKGRHRHCSSKSDPCDGCDGHEYCGHRCGKKCKENGCSHDCDGDCRTRYCSYASLNYCPHGFTGGTHTCGKEDVHGGGSCSAQDWGASHIGDCKGKRGNSQNAYIGTYCPEHGNGIHRSCYEFHWDCTTETPDVRSQNLFYVSDAQVYDNFVDCYIEEIPLVANVEINKFVYDVKHINDRTITDYNSTMTEGDARREMSEEEKEANPVYVEYGDYVTFKIEVENNSEFPIRVRVSDELPEDAEFIEAKLFDGTSETMVTLEELEDYEMPVAANNTNSMLITLLVNSLEGTYTNLGKLITRNRPDDPEWQDYIRTDYEQDETFGGPIVALDKNGNEQTKWESEDSYILNDYDLEIEKYVSSYDALVMNENNEIGFTENETSTVGNKFFNSPAGNREDYEDDLRFGMDEGTRFADPFEVEKTEKIVYSIRLTNKAEEIDPNSVALGGKQGTQVRPDIVREVLDEGLKFIDAKAMIFGSAEEVKNEDVYFVTRSLGNNTYEFEIDNKTILDPGDMLIYFVTVEIEQNNMHLLNLENTALFTKLTNVNHEPLDGEEGDQVAEERVVYEKETLDGDPGVDRNINTEEVTQEYVRLKDLIMAGKVFLDNNIEDGLMGENERRFDNITVNLYRTDNESTPIGTTKTKENKKGEHGFYTFERVDKADNKDGGTPKNGYYHEEGKYNENSEYYEYYIEFEYDGLKYKATENYGGRTEEVNPNYGDNNIDETWLPESETNYEYDSNAYEFTDVRDRYDKQFETIGFDKAYDENKYEDDQTETDGRLAKTELSYSKQGHISLLDEIEPEDLDNHRERVMTARTFIKKDVIAVEGEEQSYIDRGVNKSLDNTKTLWLYKPGNDNKLPETEYLKYMNLGLSEREEVNVSLAKDLYSITTTVNGEQITYNYGLNKVKNNEVYIDQAAGEYRTSEENQGLDANADETNGKYIDNLNYELELYESDYNYRYEDYVHEAVREYKTKDSELNIEVTFKITVTNEELIQNELHMKDPDREVLVTIDEIADLYDENFVEFTDDVETAYQPIYAGYDDKDNSRSHGCGDNANDDTILNSIDESKLVNIKVAVNAEDSKDPNAQKLVDKKLEVAKAWYYKEGEEEPRRLVLSNTSNYNRDVNRDSQYETDGYNKLYIRGFNNIQLEEGESFEIFVKYIVDKEGKEEARNILTPLNSEDSRNLKIKEKLAKQFGRENEGIGEISAYSTWYKNYDTTGETAVEKTNDIGFDVRPAGLVDKNSNPDNLGINGKSVDDVTEYEDDTYKTGIKFIVKDPMPEPTTPDPTPDPDPTPNPTPTAPPTDRVIRTVNGVVWDDSRSESENDESTGLNEQYSGNGYFNTSDEKNDFAKKNPNVEKNYKLNGVNQTEQNDIKVRNAKVELVEIVYVEAEDGTGKYYEEVIKTDNYLKSKGYGLNTAYQYTTRTDENGEYELYGFKPGYYIVRFSYGDYAEGNTDVINDMAIFNGQDYKSTKYTSAKEGDDNDTIIKALEEEFNNDAKDDEIDRLNTIAYSEIMINEKAQILRGSYYDSNDDIINDAETIKKLLQNTSMNAETVRFLVKPEKMTNDQMTEYFTLIPNPNAPTPEGNYIYKDLTNMINNHIISRDFNIDNVSLGIEYRPESQVNLVKEIDNISLKTSDGTEILRLYVNTEVTRKSTGEVESRIHTIDQARSIGLENAQFLTNEYSFPERSPELLEELLHGQGFVFVNIDEEILQGSTVTIQYRFTAENVSEIDRIGAKLDDLRFKANDLEVYKTRLTDAQIEALKDITTEGLKLNEKEQNAKLSFISNMTTNKLYKVDMSNPNADNKKIFGTNEILINNKPNANLYDTTYTAAGTASNMLVYEMYRVDKCGDIYRVSPKDEYYDTSEGTRTGYFGRYLGDYYYTAVATDNDELAQIKFDKILDYIDNDLVFKATENNEENGYWGTTTAEELKTGGYLSDRVFQTQDGKLLLLDKKNVSYDSVEGTGDNKVIKRTNLAVSISDRIKDGEQTELEIKNASMSRFLLPMKSVITSENTEQTETITGIETDPSKFKDYEGQIMLTVSKYVAQETKSEDMTYENIAEIIQFSVTSGRRTNFITTIGNASIGSGEWKTSTTESDTSAAERITFTPPTGLTRTDRVIHEVVEKTSTGLMTIGLITVIAATVLFGVRFVTYKIKKRRIK